MSILADLAAAYAARELTVPVRCGGAVTRAFFNSAGAVVRGLNVQVEHDTLFIQAGALDPDLEQEVQVQVGRLGAESVVDTDPRYRVARRDPISDGLEWSIALDGGPT